MPRIIGAITSAGLLLYGLLTLVIASAYGPGGRDSSIESGGVRLIPWWGPSAAGTIAALVAFGLLGIIYLTNPRLRETMGGMEDSDFELLDPRFTDPVAAAEYLEGLRWPNGTVCPHCGEAERVNRLKSKASHRRLWKCYGCRKQFTVTVGTIFESSHIPLNKWLAAFYLLCSSKKGMSAHQLHRMLGVTYKTAWFIFHRVREAMKEPAFTSRLSGTVEADETYIGGKRRGSRSRKRHEDHQAGLRGRPKPGGNKTAVMTLVERDGHARSFRMANVTAENLKGAIRENVEREARLMNRRPCELPGSRLRVRGP